jgi:MarR family transcriptional regulator for hemolysin
MQKAPFREVSLLIAQMRRISSVLVNKRLSAVGVTLPVYKVVLQLANIREVLQHELAYEAAMDPAALSRLIAGMVKNGLVDTRVDPQDKRQRFVRLTRKGQELERSLSPIVDAALKPYQSLLTAKEQSQLVAILRKACDGVTRIAQEAQASEQKSLRPPSRSRAPTAAQSQASAPAKLPARKRTARS